MKVNLCKHNIKIITVNAQVRDLYIWRKSSATASQKPWLRHNCRYHHQESLTQTQMQANIKMRSMRRLGPALWCRGKKILNAPSRMLKELAPLSHAVRVGSPTKCCKSLLRDNTLPQLWVKSAAQASLKESAMCWLCQTNSMYDSVLTCEIRCVSLKHAYGAGGCKYNAFLFLKNIHLIARVSEETMIRRWAQFRCLCPQIFWCSSMSTNVEMLINIHKCWDAHEYPQMFWCSSKCTKCYISSAISPAAYSD